MKFELPLKIPQNPSFPGYAALFSMLCSNDRTADWINSNFIQIHALDIVNRDKSLAHPFLAGFLSFADDRPLDPASDEFIFMPRDGLCPWLNMFEVPNEAVNGSFISFYKHCLLQGYYIYTFVDVQKINNYSLTESYSHPILIFGFNDDTQKLNVADFLFNTTKKYSMFECSFAEMDRAIESEASLSIPYLKTLTLIQHNKFYEYTFDFERVRNKIFSYICPDVNKEKEYGDYCTALYSIVGWDIKAYFGVNSYNYFANFIDKELSLGKPTIDIRLFHSMYEHKGLMLTRLHYLVENGYISGNSQHLSEYREIEKMMLLIRNKLLKFNVTEKVELLKNVR
ncbi:MAG: hypothetical protein LBE13_03845 [Bacteroidales bacterium]|nr:hypothetical protein [Bacteroidales bacterium]